MRISDRLWNAVLYGAGTLIDSQNEGELAQLALTLSGSHVETNLDQQKLIPMPVPPDPESANPDPKHQGTLNTMYCGVMCGYGAAQLAKQNGHARVTTDDFNTAWGHVQSYIQSLDAGSKVKILGLAC